MNDVANGIIDTVLGLLSEFIGTVIDNVLGIFLDIFDILFGYIMDFFTDSRFENSGASFFNTIYSKVSNFNFTFNIVYWVVGIFLGLYVFKNFIIPLIIAIYDDVVDSFTTS